MKNMTAPLYQHIRSELVPPRLKTLAEGWQEWNSAHEGAGDTIHIDYDGDYGSERVLIVLGRATVVPDDGSPSFTVGPGDAVYFMSGSTAPGVLTKRPSSNLPNLNTGTGHGGGVKYGKKANVASI